MGANGGQPRGLFVNSAEFMFWVGCMGLFPRGMLPRTPAWGDGPGFGSARSAAMGGFPGGDGGSALPRS